MIDQPPPQNEYDYTDTYESSAIFSTLLFELKRSEKLTEDDLRIIGDSETVTSILDDMEDLEWVDRCKQGWVAGPALQLFVGGESGPCEDTDKGRIQAICKECECQMSEENLNEGPEAPEIGWKYFECSNCGHQQRT